MGDPLRDRIGLCISLLVWEMIIDAIQLYSFGNLLHCCGLDRIAMISGVTHAVLDGQRLNFMNQNLSILSL